MNPLVTQEFMYLTQKDLLPVRKSLSNKFVFFITCKIYRDKMLVKFTTSIIVRQENDHDPKVFESPCKIDSIHQNDSIVANRARAVATIKEK